LPPEPRIAVRAARYSDRWLDDEQTNRFGLTFGTVAGFWRREGGIAGKFAEAKNYSHWGLAYPRLGKESMAPRS